MTMIPLSLAVELTGRDHSWLAAQCRSGMISNARKEHTIGSQGQAGWVVDLDELYQISASSPMHDHIDEPWSPLVAPSPEGDLTEIQYSAIANEYWHNLDDLQPDPAAPGAVRLYWTDGESFILHPDGDTSGYLYNGHTAQWRFPNRKLPEDDDLLILAQSHTDAEIAEMYGASRRTVHQRLQKLYQDLQRG